MRWGLIGFMVVLPVIGAVLTLQLWTALSRFQRRVPFVATRRELNQFREVAKYAMYGNLVQLLLLFAPLLLYLYGLVQRQLALPDVFYLAVPTAVYLALFGRYKRLEDKVRNVDLDNPDLVQEMVHVRDRWKSRTLPDW